MVVGLYGKTLASRQVDAHENIPLGEPKLLRSLTGFELLDLGNALVDRDKRSMGDHRKKQEVRSGFEGFGVAGPVDSGRKDARRTKLGVYG